MKIEPGIGSRGYTGRYTGNRLGTVREIRADGMLVCAPEEFTRVNDHRQEDRRKLLTFACHVDTFTAGEVEQQIGSRCLREIHDLVREGVLRVTGISRPNSKAQVLILPRDLKPGIIENLGLV